MKSTKFSNTLYMHPQVRIYFLLNGSLWVFQLCVNIDILVLSMIIFIICMVYDASLLIFMAILQKTKWGYFSAWWLRQYFALLSQYYEMMLPNFLNFDFFSLPFSPSISKFFLLYSFPYLFCILMFSHCLPYRNVTFTVRSLEGI